MRQIISRQNILARINFERFLSYLLLFLYKIFRILGDRLTANINKSYLILLLITLPVLGQSTSQTTPIMIDFGYGNSAYSNIRTEQYLFFYRISNLEWHIGNFSCQSNLNLEVIEESNNFTFLFGLAPLFRYDFTIANTKFFVKGGIGINFINSNSIGRRNIGGNFIFSDMLSIGFSLFSYHGLDVEISYMFRHISNAGFFTDNEGFNSQYIIFSFSI